MKLINRLSWSFVLILFVAACTDSSSPKTDTPIIPALEQNNDDDPSLPFDQRLRQYVERSIEIESNEKYTLKIYEEHLNDDDKKDLIITVNRLEYAIQKAKDNNNTVKSESLGFFGNYNYIIYYSSITGKFSKPIIMGSTPQRELGIMFDNISSTKHKDVIVDYAIRNAQYRKIFLFIDDRPIYAFHWKKYDGWGTPELISYCFEFGPGSYSDVKDVIVKQGKMKNIAPTADYNTEEPIIECTDILVKRFFYNTKDGKYYTPN
jgi:hypothetical protein